jgi:VanZ family protein
VSPLPRTARYGLALAWAGAVLVASVVDPPGTGPTPAGPFGLVGLDKWLHLAAYAGLAVLVGHAVLARDARTLALVALVAAVYGVGMELLQWPLAARSADPVDATVNAAGALLGAAVWRVAGRRIRDVPAPRPEGGDGDGG